MKSDVVFWLALQRILHNQPLIARRLLETYGTPEKIFGTPHPLPPWQGGRGIKDFNDWDACERDFSRCQKEGIKIVTFGDSSYPSLLKEIADPPILLMIKGNAGVLNGPCVSIVGARKASSHGKQVAFEIARELAKRGVVIVSGMAYGIDAASHMGAIEAGKTVAVWGSGIDCCYPAVFKNLSERISAAGCLVSEFPLGTRPDRWNFPRRNRIISGLSMGVVIVEAAAKSGSLITVRFALEQGREVFAVPGAAGGTMSQGTNDLLRNGATFAENADDIISALEPQIR